MIRNQIERPNNTDDRRSSPESTPKRTSPGTFESTFLVPQRSAIASFLVATE